MTRRAARTHFIPELEATRGIAALLVAGYHAAGVPITVNGAQTSLIEAAVKSEHAVERIIGMLLATVLNGESAVLYFFVLSGFVLAASLARDEQPPWAAAWRFGLRRLFRIYPAVIFSVIACTALYYGSGFAMHPEAFGFASILRNAALMDVSVNGVMWTMQTELLATPLVFVCFLFAARGRMAATVAIAALLAALSFMPGWNHLFISQNISRTEPLYAFAFGVLAWLNGRRIFDLIGSHRRGAMIAAILAFLFASPLLGFGTPIAALVQVSASALVVALLTFGREASPSRVLTSAPARLIGRVSFSFYLLHPLTLAVVWPMTSVWTGLTDTGLPPPLLILGLWIATSAAILPLAIFSYRYVELPAIALGRRVGGARMPEAAPVKA